MAVFKSYEEIGAWKAGRELVRDVYALTRSGEFAKDFGLKDQIQRAAVSVCSNIKSISTSEKGITYTR